MLVGETFLGVEDGKANNLLTVRICQKYGRNDIT